MTASEMSTERKALEETRSRLETALAGDENWRALRQSGQGDTPNSAAHHARNTRLKLALAENPLYQAWWHVNEAIAALRADGDSRAPDVPNEHGLVAPAELADETTSDVMRDISPDVAGVAAGAFTPSPALERPKAEGEPLPEAKEEEIPPPPADDTPVSVAAETVNRAPNRDRRAEAPRGVTAVEPEEATVTFVRRSPLAPDEIVSEPGEALSEQPADKLQLGGAYSPAGTNEEAEVIIVTPEDVKEEARARTIRRLRKALTGN